MGFPPEPLAVRIERHIIPEPNSGCWLWDGFVEKFGYGAIGINKRRRHAHRVSWQVYRGPIPHGLYVLHKCDVPSCVNPVDHAELTGLRAACRKLGSANGSAKLTEDQVREIRRRYAGGERQIPLAAAFGVSQRMISLIVRKEKWQHV